MLISMDYTKMAWFIAESNQIPWLILPGLI